MRELGVPLRNQSREGTVCWRTERAEYSLLLWQRNGTGAVILPGLDNTELTLRTNRTAVDLGAPPNPVRPLRTPPEPEQPIPQPPQPEIPPSGPEEPHLPSPGPEPLPTPVPGPTDPALPRPVVNLDPEK
jgi:hypothetical protein